MKRFLAVVPVFVLILFSSCTAQDPTVAPDTGTAVALTQTAAMWTATPITPSPTVSPNQAVIVDALNGALRGTDLLRDAIDAKFHVADVGFDANGNPPILVTLRVRVECEWIIRPSCTPERAFVVLIHAIEREGVRNKVIEQIPTTIEFLQIDSFDHLTQIGSLVIRWQDVLAFTKNEITGEQLAARILHFSP